VKQEGIFIVTNEILILAGTAASIGFIHTLLGPDHYLPFIAMSKARGWSWIRTAAITALCGLGHVMSSVVLGFLGVFLGLAVFKLESFEALRGDWAGWLLIAFGLVYMLWGLRQAVRSRTHEHRHTHSSGEIHAHPHSHIGGHSHVHIDGSRRTLTPWILFTVFVLGPCEPLIPLIMYPASRLNYWAVVLVALVFGIVTVFTMLACVMAACYGLSRLSFPRMARYAHALAGLTILLCGTAIQFGL